VSVAGRSWPSELPTSIVLPKENESGLPDSFASDDTRYTERLVEIFCDALTNEGDVVLDPFSGFGTTMVVAERMGREGWGVEIDVARVDFIRARVMHPDRLLLGDSRALSELPVPAAQLIMTSPPYSSPYEPQDALSGSVEPSTSYGDYLSQIQRLFAGGASKLRPEGWLVVEASNLKHSDGSVTTLAWDIASAIGEELPFVGEVVVTWEPTYGYGYDHSYCLVFAAS
jgi:hypothetical protein